MTQSVAAVEGVVAEVPAEKKNAGWSCRKYTSYSTTTSLTITTSNTECESAYSALPRDVA